MVQTKSTMLELGTTLPAFRLVDTVTGREVSHTELAGRPLLVAFICNHCPFVKHVRSGIAELGRHCASVGVGMVAISSNDPASHPADGPEHMAAEARSAGYGFPYLFDESQSVARAFRAACTPEFYVFDAGGQLAYRGQMDGARPNNQVPITGEDVRAAIADVLAGRKPSPEQKPSIGCNIKWKLGSEPDYAS
jgi:hypothetical protein